MMNHCNELYIVRHGETAGESSIRYYGATDIGLSDTGRRQMELTSEVLKGIPFRRVITSPMKRSKESAAIVLNSHGKFLDELVVEDFREINFGDWEGMTAEEIAAHDPERYHVWRHEGRLDAFPGGDSRAGFFDRVRRAAGRVFGDVELPALAVLHKGVIKGILAELLGEPDSHPTDRRIELGSIQRLRRCNGGWELAAANEALHLGEYRMEHS